jgi:opacity protein-like surface antigen
MGEFVVQTKMLALACLGCIGLSAAPAQAESGWVLGPAFKPGWKPAFTLAVTGSYLDPDLKHVDGDSVYGLQLSLNCPWFQPPSGVIRQQFNVNRFENNGITLTTYEINPRYYISLNRNWMVGFGPGFGYAEADVDVGKDANLWTLQLGADLEYRRDAFYFGAGVRYQNTENETIGLNDNDADNWLTSLKIGFNF